ncbi:MAG: sulfur oxidation c-type cytochrome SoxX [Rhodospirillaceae bacterium]
MTATPKNRGLRSPAIAWAAALAGLAMAGSATAAEIARVHEPGLQPYTIVGHEIPQPLTTTPGDAERGKKAFVTRSKGNCLACHTAPIPEEDFHGEIGPSLVGVADRLTASEMRLRIVDAKAILPDSMMPSFYRTAGLRQLKKDFVGKSMLEPQDIEDIIAYLQTLK